MFEAPPAMLFPVHSVLGAPVGIGKGRDLLYTATWRKPRGALRGLSHGQNNSSDAYR